jgi:hypothetical protein
MFYFTDPKWVFGRAILQISNAGSHDLKHGFKGCSQGGAGKDRAELKRRHYLAICYFSVTRAG